MTKQNTWAKIMAFLALFWIIIWIVWTWILILFNWWNNTAQTISPEQYLELQDYINTQSGSTVQTGAGNEIK